MNRRLVGVARATPRPQDAVAGWLVYDFPDQNTSPRSRVRIPPQDAVDASPCSQRERRTSNSSVARTDRARGVAGSVSRERVRQIEVSAFEKVQNAVKHRVAAMGTPAPLQVR